MNNIKVSIVSCEKYQVDLLESSIKTALEKAELPEVKGKTILFKVNLLTATRPGAAVTTNPAFVKAAARVFKDFGAAKILVGDSSAAQRGPQVWKKCGLQEAAADKDFELVNFNDKTEINLEDPLLVPRFTVASVLTEVDMIISMPKLKTHSLMFYTGAMKNMFGAIVGLEKAQYHMRFPEKDRFGQMLIDLNRALKPEFCLMDAVVGMEGPGPQGGDSRHVGFVMASRNVLALDLAALIIIGYKAEELPLYKDALKLKTWPADFENIEYTDINPEDVIIKDYKRVEGHDGPGFMKVMPGFLKYLLEGVLIKKPKFLHKICIRCGKCLQICPASALSWKDKKGQKEVAIDYSKCIRCYCCHEVCPEKAIDLKIKLF